jgi:hypothetical protein
MVSVVWRTLFSGGCRVATNAIATSFAGLLSLPSEKRDVCDFCAFETRNACTHTDTTLDDR